MNRSVIFIVMGLVLSGCMTPAWRSAAIRNSCDRLSSVESYYAIDIRHSYWKKPPVWVRKNQKRADSEGGDYHTVGGHRFRSDHVYNAIHPFPTKELLGIIRRDEKDRSPPLPRMCADYAVLVMLRAQSEYAGMIVLNDSNHFRILWPLEEDADRYHFHPIPYQLRQEKIRFANKNAEPGGSH